MVEESKTSEYYGEINKKKRQDVENLRNKLKSLFIDNYKSLSRIFVYFTENDFSQNVYKLENILNRVLMRLNNTEFRRRRALGWAFTCVCVCEFEHEFEEIKKDIESDLLSWIMNTSYENKRYFNVFFDSFYDESKLSIDSLSQDKARNLPGYWFHKKCKEKEFDNYLLRPITRRLQIQQTEEDAVGAVPSPPAENVAQPPPPPASLSAVALPAPIIAQPIELEEIEEAVLLNLLNMQYIIATKKMKMEATKKKEDTILATKKKKIMVATMMKMKHRNAKI